MPNLEYLRPMVEEYFKTEKGFHGKRGRRGLSGAVLKARTEKAMRDLYRLAPSPVIDKGGRPRKG